MGIIFKYLSLLFLISSRTICGFSQIMIPNTPIEKKLQINEIEKIGKQQIHTKTTWLFEIFQGVATRQQERISMITYSLEGYPVEKAFYSDNDNVEMLIRYEYNKEGNLFSEAAYTPTGEIINTKLYSYNEFGDLKLISEMDESRKILRSSSFKQDKIVSSVTETEFNEDVQPVRKIVYDYSTPDGDTGFLKQKISTKLKSKDLTDSRDSIEYKIEYSYLNGKLAEETCYNAENLLMYNILYKYDLHGNLTEKVKFSPKKEIIQKETFLIDQNNNAIRYAKYNKFGSLVRMERYEYGFVWY